jgi:cyclophilin family peptidyl-prolyl cis-trans isomerase
MAGKIMPKLKTAFLLLCCFVTVAAAAAPQVTLDTSEGKIVLALDADKAPGTVANFVEYVRAGHYNGTIFHRVIPGFMIQGGGFTPDMKQKPTRAPIENEADNGLRNRTGTIAMARTDAPHSATAQFYINVNDNGSLDHRNRTAQGYGYAVFGKVIEGMDVVQRIVSRPTVRVGPYENVPRQPVIIRSATLVSSPQ